MAVVLHVELTLVPGRRDAYVARAQRHRATVLATEPGCSRFDISIPEDVDNVVRLYEVYDDMMAFDHHMETPHMQEYRADTQPMIENRRSARAIMAND